MLPIDEVVAPLAVHEVEKELQDELQDLLRSVASPLLLLRCPPWACYSAIPLLWASRAARTVSRTDSR